MAHVYFSKQIIQIEGGLYPGYSPPSIFDFLLLGDLPVNICIFLGNIFFLSEIATIVAT